MSDRWMAGLCLIALAGITRADDWPQWMGEHRDGIWRESGIVESLPADGPSVRWRLPVAGGYAGPSVADGRVYVTDFQSEGELANDPNSRAERSGTERLLCVDDQTGKILWTYANPCTYRISYPSGPRATPTVDAGKVYFLGAEGHLACLDAKTGKRIWSRELPAEYKAQVPIWGYSAHPLIVGDVLYTLAGGDGSLVVSLDKNSGKENWRALSSGDIGYASPTYLRAGGVDQLVVFYPEGLSGLDPKTGKVHWTFSIQPGYGMSIMAPQSQGQYLFVGAVGTSLMVELDRDKPSARELWRGGTDKGIQAVCASPLLNDALIYGVDRNGQLRGVDINNGKHIWETMDVTTRGRPANSATAFLVKNGDRHFIFGETGDLVIAQLSPDGFREISRAHLIEPTNEAFGRPVVWSHPAFANRSIYVRNDKELAVFSLAK